MLDILDRIAHLRRPRLLVRAARFGVDDYRRETSLPRLLGLPSPSRPTEAIVRLLDQEAGHDERRRGQATDYAVARHIEVLTALMGEARQLQAARALT